MELFNGIGNIDRPDGAVMYVHPKAKNAMTASALTTYAERLLAGLTTCDEGESTAILEKAGKALLKAYAVHAVHNLPVYLFQAAGTFEQLGDFQSATKFFALFLEMQEEFRPDEVDEVFLKQTGLNLPKIIAMAKARVQGR